MSSNWGKINTHLCTPHSQSMVVKKFITVVVGRSMDASGNRPLTRWDNECLVSEKIDQDCGENHDGIGGTIRIMIG